VADAADIRPVSVREGFPSIGLIVENLPGESSAVLIFTFALPHFNQPISI